MTERFTVTAYFGKNPKPLVFVVFQKDMLEKELDSLKKMGYGPIEVKHENL